MNDIVVKKEDSPYIFSFPHSGERLIAEMNWQLKPEAKRFLPNVDWHLPKLYAFLEQYQVNIISTPHSRYVVDVNRPPDAQKFGNYRRSLVYETNTWDEEIYDLKPTSEELERRIQRYYESYHKELELLVAEKVAKFGKAYLIDLHSFMGPIEEDVCLGNTNNTTSSEAFIEKFYNAFQAEGFNTVKNRVFIGGYITKSYAIPNVVETLQIELRYTNYIEPQELDIRSSPRSETTLFYETAFRLENVFEQVGVYKREEEKAEILNEQEIDKNRKKKRLHMMLFLLFFVLAIALSLIE